GCLGGRDGPREKGLPPGGGSDRGLPPPPKGGGGGGGGELAHMNLVAYPLPLPPPQAGGCTEHAASLCFSTNEHVLFLHSRFRSLIDGSEPERFERRLVGLLVEELPQAGIVGVLLVGVSDRLALLCEIVVGLRDVPVSDCA